MQNRSSTPILPNLVGVHPTNVHKTLKQIRAAIREMKLKNKKVHADNDNDDGHRVIARVTR